MSFQPYQPPAPPSGSRRRRANKVILIVAGSILGLFVLLAALGAALGSGKQQNTAATAATTRSTTPAASPSASAKRPAAAAAPPANGGTYPSASAILARLAAGGLNCTAPSQMAENAAVLFDPGATSLITCTSPGGTADDTQATVFDTQAHLQAYEKQIETTGSSIAGGQLVGMNWAIESTPAYATSAKARLGGVLTVIPGSKATQLAQPADSLTGFGATTTTWDAHHIADSSYNAGSAFDPESNLPQANGREADRYVAVQYQGGLVLNYQVNEPADTTVSAALADVVSHELPPDATVLWKQDDSANGCYQEEVASKTLGAVLSANSAGDAQGAVFLEVQSASLSAFDPSNVADVSVSTGDGSLTAAQAPGC